MDAPARQQFGGWTGDQNNRLRMTGQNLRNRLADAKRGVKK